MSEKPVEMSPSERAALSLAQRMKLAHADAVRYAAICYLPLEPQSNKPSIPAASESWFDIGRNLTAYLNHGTKTADACATDEIKNRTRYYDQAEPSAEAINDIKQEAQKRAQVGAAKGQVRERTYGRY